MAYTVEDYVSKVGSVYVCVCVCVCVREREREREKNIMYALFFCSEIQCS